MPLAPFALIALLSLSPVAAWGAGLFSTDIQNTVVLGKETARVTVFPDSDYASMTLKLERNDGKTLTLVKKNIKDGKRVDFTWSVEAGQWHYSGTLDAVWTSSEEFEVPMDFDVVCAPPLKIEVPRDSIDLDGLKLKARVDRVASRAEIELIGLNGPFETAEASFDDPAPDTPLEIEWYEDDEVIKLVVRVWDQHGFLAFEEITPWSLAIPHEDVVFESNSDVVRTSEEQKLVRAADVIQETINKYGKYVDIKLYIAGYTDTVDDKGHNQELSKRRARAISAWFSRAGFGIPVYYQGFGEDVLAVQTDDNVDMEANRRALYVLGAHPPSGTSFPRGNWELLR